MLPDTSNTKARSRPDPPTQPDAEALPVGVTAVPVVYTLPFAGDVHATDVVAPAMGARAKTPSAIPNTAKFLFIVYLADNCRLPSVNTALSRNVFRKLAINPKTTLGLALIKQVPCRWMKKLESHGLLREQLAVFKHLKIW
jgi:hypothetical protein